MAKLVNIDYTWFENHHLEADINDVCYAIMGDFATRGEYLIYVHIVDKTTARIVFKDNSEFIIHCIVSPSRKKNNTK